MRVACIHIPQFALQAANRNNPALAGASVALVPGGVNPVVVGLSKQAALAGVRLGVSAAAARGLGVAVMVEDPIVERELVGALADALLAVASAVELGGRTGPNDAHYAMYVRVPAKTRGLTFGGKVRALCAELGVNVRVGIADDRFTAWVAACQLQPQRANARLEVADDGNVGCVPRGGAAAFLAPLPLSLLPISLEVQHMLAALGINTLGAFAALPEPTVARSSQIGRFDAERDLLALARGEGPAFVAPCELRPVISERVAVSAEHSLVAAVRTLATRLALVLQGRGQVASQLQLTVTGQTSRSLDVALFPPLADGDALAERLGALLGGVEEVISLTVEVTGRSVVATDTLTAPSDPVAGAANDEMAANGVLRANGDGADDLVDLPTLALTPLAGFTRSGRRPLRRGKQRRRAVVSAQLLFA